MNLTIGSDGNVYDSAGNLRTDLYAQDGCIYDTDGNRLDCPGGIIPLPGSPSVDLPLRPTVITLPDGHEVGQYMDSNGNMQYILLTTPQAGSTTPPGRPQTSWDKFTQWLSSPVAPGWPSNGAAVGIAAVAAALWSFSSGGSGRGSARGRRR